MQLCPESVLRETKFLYRNRHSTFISGRQYSTVDLFRDAANLRPQASGRMIYRTFPARKALSKTNIIFIYYLLGLEISLLWLHVLYSVNTNTHTNKQMHIFIDRYIYRLYVCRHIYTRLISHVI